MKRTLRIVLWAAALTMPAQLWATENCFQCVLGIWDDPALTRNIGEIVAGQPKDIYVGIKFAEGYHDIDGIELSVAGLQSFLVMEWEPIIPPPVIMIENIQAPADTSTSSTSTGGINVFWHDCLVGDQALLRVRILASGDVTNGVLQVKRHYPPRCPR